MIVDIQEMRDYSQQDSKKRVKRSREEDNDQDREPKYSMPEGFYYQKELSQILKIMVFKNLENIIMLLCDEIHHNDICLAMFWNIIIEEMNKEMYTFFNLEYKYESIHNKNDIVNVSSNDYINQLYPKLLEKIKLETITILKDFIILNFNNFNDFNNDTFLATPLMAVGEIRDYLEGCTFIDMLKHIKFEHRYKFINDNNDYTNSIMRNIKQILINS